MRRMQLVAAVVLLVLVAGCSSKKPTETFTDLCEAVEYISDLVADQPDDYEDEKDHFLEVEDELTEALDTIVETVPEDGTQAAETVRDVFELALDAYKQADTEDEFDEIFQSEIDPDANAALEELDEVVYDECEVTLSGSIPPSTDSD
jgi:hypothetical protein